MTQTSLPDCRIDLLSKEEALQRGQPLGIDDYICQLNLFRVLLHFPELAAELNKTIITLVSSDSVLSHRLRELIIMRVAWLTRSEYEWTQHWQVSLLFGLTEDEIVAVRDWKTADCFTAEEQAVLAATDDTLQQGKISSAVWQQLEQQLLTPEARITVVTSIGNWQMFSQLLRSLQIPLEEGQAFWPPDGKAPD